MTPKQVELIKRLIAAERDYWREALREAKGEKATCPSQDLKWVEVAGKFNGVDRRTATSLEEAGLVEMMQGWTERQTVIWLKDDFWERSNEG
jgi:hypothetical protein